MVDLLGDRLNQLDEERRLKPVDVTFTLGAKPHKIYLFAMVRQGKCFQSGIDLLKPSSSLAFLFAEVTEDQLNDLLDELNSFVDGKSPADQIDTVKAIIRDTGSSVRPGVPYLPENYEPGQGRPEKVMSRDEAGLPVLASEDEISGIVASERGTKRHSDSVNLPSTASRLPPARTDDEASSPAKKQKRDEKSKEGKETVSD